MVAIFKTYSEYTYENHCAISAHFSQSTLKVINKVPTK